MTELHVCTHDWPTTDKPLDPNLVRRVLASFDEHFPAAVRSLAHHTPPAQAEADHGQLAAGEGGEG